MYTYLKMCRTKFLYNNNALHYSQCEVKGTYFFVLLFCQHRSYKKITIMPQKEMRLTGIVGSKSACFSTRSLQMDKSSKKERYAPVCFC